MNDIYFIKTVTVMSWYKRFIYYYYSDLLLRYIPRLNFQNGMYYIFIFIVQFIRDILNVMTKCWLICDHNALFI